MRSLICCASRRRKGFWQVSKLDEGAILSYIFKEVKVEIQDTVYHLDCGEVGWSSAGVC